MNEPARSVGCASRLGRPCPVQPEARRCDTNRMAPGPCRKLAAAMKTLTNDEIFWSGGPGTLRRAATILVERARLTKRVVDVSHIVAAVAQVARIIYLSSGNFRDFGLICDECLTRQAQLWRERVPNPISKN